VSALASYVDRCGDGSGTLGSVRSRFEAACARGLSAPGATNVAAQISDCSMKLSTASCSGGEVDCELVGGTLEDGAACAESYQCRSGACKTEPGSSCGRCAPKVPIGGDCTSSANCVEGAACAFDTSDRGKCVALKLAKAGEKCSSSGDEVVRCDSGLECSFTSGELTCKAPGGAGADCSSRFDCTDGLRCVDNKCAAGLGEGATCTLDECAKGLDCSKEKKCARIVYVKGGEECDSTRRCDRGTCLGSSVTTGPGGTVIQPGKCVDPLPDGAACSSEPTADEPRCDVFAECIGGKCTLADPAQCK